MKIITSIPSGKQKNLFLAIGFVLFWNSGFIGAEYGLPYTGPFTLVFWRYLALTILIFLYLLIKKRFRRINRPVIAYNMLVGFLAHGVWLSCVLLALEQDVPAGIIALVVALQPLLRHEVVLYNCFTVSCDRLIKPAVPSAVSYRSIGCMVQPLSGEASGKHYQSLARVANNEAENREEFGLWGLNTN
jgi:hypothetical protein